MVKYKVVATEDNTQVFIVAAARGNNGQPTPSQPDDSPPGLESATSRR